MHIDAIELSDIHSDYRALAQKELKILERVVAFNADDMTSFARALELEEE